MATEADIVLEDDYNYLAVCRVDGPARSGEGTTCCLEIGRGGEAPDDRQAAILMLDRQAVAELIAALTATLAPPAQPPT